MKVLQVCCAALVLTSLCWDQVHAIPVSIASYDIAGTPGMGFGCWSHSYTGTITDTRRTVNGSGSISCTTDGEKVLNYAGGGGTLNDHVISTSVDDTHLLVSRDADDGIPVNPVITLHLNGTWLIHSIRLYGGHIDFNAIPGALNGVAVNIEGVLLELDTIPVGSLNAIGEQEDDLLDLSGTALSLIPTSMIVLHSFSSSLFGSPFDQFSITEVTIDGEPMVVAAPAPLGLLAIGWAAFAAAGLRRRTGSVKGVAR